MVVFIEEVPRGRDEDFIARSPPSWVNGGDRGGISCNRGGECGYSHIGKLPMQTDVTKDAPVLVVDKHIALKPPCWRRSLRTRKPDSDLQQQP